MPLKSIKVIVLNNLTEAGWFRSATCPSKALGEGGLPGECGETPQLCRNRELVDC